MRILFFVSLVYCILTGTSFTASAQRIKNAVNIGIASQPSPKFIDDIEIRADRSSVVSMHKAAQVALPFNGPVDHSLATGSDLNIENISSVQFKYAQLLNRNVEFLKNISLYRFIDEWWGIKYRYGGSTKKGIDCSAFTGLLIGSVFGIKLPRTAREQYGETEKLDKEDMREGDLVFFNTRGGVSHVGVYLGDSYFVHASTNNGVMISSLDDSYYASRFISGGRPLNNPTD
ncbi:hypothetical protein BH11BAC4_BH11BAC4_14020 [soil metagenome]